MITTQKPVVSYIYTTPNLEVEPSYANYVTNCGFTITTETLSIYSRILSPKM